ncbi:MAG: hypothetical protein IKR59_07015 [Lachnospiraceae bacterium]|nr:hypothetical protein [Lachnospiraceae bacterium]
MEEGLIIGFDLCKDFCRISYFVSGEDEPADLVFSEEENPYVVQNSICKKKGEDTWFIGQEAYETALLGGGSIVDKLLRLVGRNGHATFDGVQFSAEELLYHFLEETLKVLFREKKTNRVLGIMYSVQELNTTVLDAVIRCTKRLGIERKRIHIISHTESYLYYVLSQRRELWSNVSVLYDLSGDGLNYYELEVLRGMQPNVARAKRTFLEEGFSLDILDSAAGRKMADNIMTSCVDRMMKKKLVSSAYLSGRGMDSCQKWGENFLRILCQRRKVFFIENIFAKGAVYAACEYLRENSVYPFSIMCEGRIDVDISMELTQGNVQKTMYLASVGSNWYETRESFDIIPDQETAVRMKVKRLGERVPIIIEVPMDEFPQRAGKTTRVNVGLNFDSDNMFTITLTDKGFGEFFPGSEKTVRKTFTIGNGA